jgi:hypothetical protein
MWSTKKMVLLLLKICGLKLKYKMAVYHFIQGQTPVQFLIPTIQEVSPWAHQPDNA